MQKKPKDWAAKALQSKLFSAKKFTDRKKAAKQGYQKYKLKF